MYKRTPLEKRLRRRKGSLIYRFWGYDYRNERYDASTHQTDYKAALDAARHEERKRAVPPTDQAANETAALVAAFTLSDALGLLGAHDKRVNAAKKTVQFHTERGRHLVRLLGAETPCAQIELPEVEKYTDQRIAEGGGRHTVQKEHRVLRQAFGLAKAAGMYSGDPKRLTVAGFKKARHFYTPGSTWLERVEYIEALIAHTSANPDQHRVDRRDDILAYVNIGVRRRELLLVNPEHVDLRKRVINVREPKVARDARANGIKTPKSRRAIPLNDVMVELFKRRLRGAPAGVPLFVEWGSGNRDLKANWNRARAALIAAAKTRAERADLDATLPRTLTFNDLRRTFCSQMKNAGVSFEDCAELLGHADIAMVRLVYGHTTVETLRAAVDKLPQMELPPQRLPRPKGPSRRERQLARAAARAGTAPAESPARGTATVSATNRVSKTVKNGTA